MRHRTKSIYADVFFVEVAASVVLAYSLAYQPDSAHAFSEIVLARMFALIAVVGAAQFGIVMVVLWLKRHRQTNAARGTSHRLLFQTTAKHGCNVVGLKQTYSREEISR